MRFCRVLFGIKSSPFLLNATVRSHVLNYRKIQPDIAKTLLSCLHVDCFNAGANTLREAFDLYVNVKNILKDSSFHLRKFKSNNTELENQFYLKDPEDKEHSSEQNVLGITWNKTSDEPNLVMESGVQSSLHPNCHHQLVFAKFSLSIYYPPPYERTVWYYNRASSALIRRAIDLFDWDKALCFNDVDKQVAIFHDTLMNIMQNFVCNETIICDDRDTPWMNKEIKQLIEQKNQFYKGFIRINKTLLYINQFNALQDELGFLIEKSKNNYH